MPPHDPRTLPERHHPVMRFTDWASSCLFALWLPAIAHAQTWTDITPSGGPVGTNTGFTQGVCYEPTSNRLTIYIPSVPGFIESSVWVLTNANGQGRSPVWIQLTPSGSAPVDAKDAAIACDPLNNRLIVYGGCSGYCGTTLSTVRVLNNANGLGGTPAWSSSTVTNPRARAAHSGALDVAGDRLISLAGADATPGTDQNDVAVLSNAGGTVSPSTWTALAPAPPLPSPRESHGTTYLAAQNTLLVFGGRQITSLSPAVMADYNDLWVLSNANGLSGTPAWTQLAAAGTLPTSRWSHSVTYDPTHNRLIVFGGRHWNPITMTLEELSDLWALTHADGLGGTPTWIELSSTGRSPEFVGRHGAALDEANDQLIVAGAGSDSGIHVWVRSAPLPVELQAFEVF